MSDPVIRVENLSKRYRIGERQQYGALRDVLANAAAATTRRLRSMVPGSPADPGRSAGRTIWALRDVSFELNRGEILGIIGHNGAGKSTLLKILSRITKPTRGSVKMRGKVGSLLEVGTGFHPELTGRENIFLNGAVIGMERAEIERKFDEIVAFAEQDAFIDTPVKRYSSGMYLRLAFAVAAHLETEIVIVDEVLAVGDAAFQKKCLGKMGEVANAGRTVLFVSHNMNAIQRLCPRCMLLEHGRMAAHGETSIVVERYLSRHLPEVPPSAWFDVSHAVRQGTQEARLRSIAYSSLDSSVQFRPFPGGPLEFKLQISSNTTRTLGSLAITLYDRNGTKLVNADTMSIGRIVRLEEGDNVVRIRISELHLNPGEYRCGWWLSDPFGKIFDYVEFAFNIKVIDREAGRLGARPRSDGTVKCRFQVSQD